MSGFANLRRKLKVAVQIVCWFLYGGLLLYCMCLFVFNWFAFEVDFENIVHFFLLC